MKRLPLEDLHQPPRTAPPPPRPMNQQLLYLGPERARLGGRHGKHDDADDLGPLGASAGYHVRAVVAQEHEDEARAGGDLGDTVLPPSEELLV